MSRRKGSGKKAKLSVSIDRIVLDKLNQRFKNDLGGKSKFVNWILADNLDNYFIRLDKVGSTRKIQMAPLEEAEIVFETTKSRKNLKKGV